MFEYQFDSRLYCQFLNRRLRFRSRSTIVKRFCHISRCQILKLLIKEIHHRRLEQQLNRYLKYTLAIVLISMKAFSLILLSQALRWGCSEATNVSLTLHTKSAPESTKITLPVDVVLEIDISFEQTSSTSTKRYISPASTLTEAPGPTIIQTSILTDSSTSPWHWPSDPLLPSDWSHTASALASYGSNRSSLLHASSGSIYWTKPTAGPSIFEGQGTRFGAPRYFVLCIALVTLLQYIRR